MRATRATGCGCTGGIARSNLLESAGVWRFCFGGGEEFGALDPEIEVRLREQFRPEIEALERLVGPRPVGVEDPRKSTRSPRAPLLKSERHRISVANLMPRVSVIVPVFNAARTIEQADRKRARADLSLISR